MTKLVTVLTHSNPNFVFQKKKKKKKSINTMIVWQKVCSLLVDVRFSHCNGIFWYQCAILELQQYLFI